MSKADNIRECADIAKKHDAQAVIIIRVERDGTITTSTYGENKQKCNAIGTWAQGWMDHALSIVPFRTIFGWGNGGMPKPLTDLEEDLLDPSGRAYHDRMSGYGPAISIKV